MDQNVQRASKLDTTALSDALDRLGIPGQCLGIKPLDHRFRLAGRAFTLLYGPASIPPGTVGDFIEDTVVENPFQQANYHFLQERLVTVLSELSERERTVLELRFGLKDGYERTLEEVGRKLNVTRERVRQIEAKALKKLRHPGRIKQLEGFGAAEDLAA